AKTSGVTRATLALAHRVLRKPPQRANWLKEGKLNSLRHESNAFLTNILLLAGARRNKQCWPKADRRARGKVDTVKVFFLNRCRPLRCYEVKASACSESHSQTDINVQILHPVIDFRNEEHT